MKYRSRTEIVGLILEARNGGGATKTKIMYKSISIICSAPEYLTMLQDNELIEYEEGKHAYRTTEKGMKLLELYENMSELVPPLFTTVEGKFASIEVSCKMNQINTTRTILAVIIAAALVVSVSSLTAPADATKPKHNDDDDDNGNNSGGDNVVNTLPQQPQLAPLGMGISPNAGDSVGGDDTASQQAQPQAQPQQQAQQPQVQQAQPQQAASTKHRTECGQVVSGVVNLTANLNCNSGDGIIVGGPNTVINMNGFSITGPGQDEL